MCQLSYFFPWWIKPCIVLHTISLKRSDIVASKLILETYPYARETISLVFSTSYIDGGFGSRKLGIFRKYETLFDGQEN